MPKPPLQEPYRTLESEMIATMLAGLHEWRPDLSYPESHSDMQGCTRGLFQMFDIKRRELPRSMSEIVVKPHKCAVCDKPAHTSFGETAWFCSAEHAHEYADRIKTSFVVRDVDGGAVN